jgi:hypothetical protein
MRTNWTPFVERYNRERFPFATCVEYLFGCGDLTKLHTVQAYEKFTRATDQSTIFHRKFYEFARTDMFRGMYRAFIRDVAIPSVDSNWSYSYGREPYLYQRVPTFRVHFPGNVAVGEYHRDRDYNHAPEEMNLWLPLTPTNEANTVWIEDRERESRYVPWMPKIGEVLVFDGANLMHGNVENYSDKTRVSFDFRLLHCDDYRPSDRKTINAQMTFAIGDFWETL